MEFSDGLPLRSFDADRPDGSPRDVEEALAHWDQLSSAELEELLADPEQGPRLRHLWRSETWLGEQGEQPGRETGVHPSSDELYDLGRGPGARALPETERRRLEAHVRSCEECSGFVETLATSPPVPLLADPPAEDPQGPEEEDSGQLHQLPGPSTASPWRTWLPLAAAAGLVAVGLVWQSGVSGKDRQGFPEEPHLRGQASDSLLYPRGRVLHQDLATSPTAAWLRAPSFELDPALGASEYRIRLRRHSGSALAAGDQLLELRGPSPILEIVAADAALLTVAGRYTWEAWAVVDGLDRPLGSREFQVVEDSELSREITRLGIASGDEGNVMDLVHRLHGAGFPTDARQVARQLLAPSPERDEYLGRKPGR